MSFRTLIYRITESVSGGICPLSLCFTVTTASLLLFACGHVAHRAGVEPGFNSSVLVSPVYETYHEPPPGYWETQKEPTWGVDIQGNFGYAWAIGQNRRFLLQAVFLKSPESTAPLVEGLDLYYQTASGETNAGVGLLVGLDPRLYLMWGHDHPLEGKLGGSGFDFGLAFAPAGISIIPQLMYTMSLGNVQPSIFLEYRHLLSSAEIFCDENCSDADNIRSRFSVGLMISFGPAR